MDWRAIVADIAKLGLPALGMALGGPTGAAVGSELAAHIGAPSAEPSAVLSALQAGGDALAKAHDFELTRLQVVTSAQLEQLHAEVAQLSQVNETMRAEAAASGSESWYQKAWRPFNGFVVGVGSLLAVVGCCWLMWRAIRSGDTQALQFVPSLAFNLTLILSIPGAAVGIAAWHRGVAQVEAVKAGAS